MKKDKFDLVRFTDNDFELDVRADSENETVWLTQDEMARLFDVDRTRIVRHINNIYKEQELQKSSTCAENAQVQKEGDRIVRRLISLYNLDMIISVGYLQPLHHLLNWCIHLSILMCLNPNSMSHCL